MAQAAFGASLEWLKGQGVEVQRYNPAQQYDVFVSNPAVVATINERGSETDPKRRLATKGEPYHE